VKKKLHRVMDLSCRDMVLTGRVSLLCNFQPCHCIGLLCHGMVLVVWPMKFLQMVKLCHGLIMPRHDSC